MSIFTKLVNMCVKGSAVSIWRIFSLCLGHGIKCMMMKRLDTTHYVVVCNLCNVDYNWKQHVYNSNAMSLLKKTQFIS